MHLTGEQMHKKALAGCPNWGDLCNVVSAGLSWAINVAHIPARQSGGAFVTERLYFENPGVYVLADYDAYLGGGRALCVVCEHPDGAGYAAQLAQRLGVPLQLGSAAGETSTAGDTEPSAAPAGRTRTGPAAAV
jgi:hypothetical protein